ncbi:hypothetical protein R3P38DRAFT_2381409, partial [Favolaschia claudopus]
MKMPLPKDVPTLRAKASKNLTRPDNVFCSEGLFPFFTACNAFPEWTPGTTDHFPVVSTLDLVPPSKEKVERRDWRAADWEEFRKMLRRELEGVAEVEGYASVEEVENGIRELDAAIQRCVEEHVPLRKVSPHSKRWWTAELTERKKVRDRLALRSTQQLEFEDSPTHEEYRKARNGLSAAIRTARATCWEDWLEDIDGTDVWTA